MQQLHKHRFDNVTDYLHHRSPYLMVDRILSISETEVVTEKVLSGDEYFFQGHFPGAQVLPGAMMQEMTTQSAGILIAAEHNPMQEYNTHDPHFNEYALGVLVKVKRARYRGFARPGDQLTATIKLQEVVGDVFEFSASIVSEGQRLTENRFQLTNIKSSVLSGVPS
ncbi:MAG: hypothetical protein AAF483_07080 [Planctomycetota bacterium]